jgi:hypothetical protein
MPKFKFFIDPIAKKDIQDGIDYYNLKAKGLGRKFRSEVKSSFNSISKSSYLQVR